MGERMGKAPPSSNPIRQGNDSLGTPIFLNPLDPQITHLPLFPLPQLTGQGALCPLRVTWRAEPFTHTKKGSFHSLFAGPRPLQFTIK